MSINEYPNNDQTFAAQWAGQTYTNVTGADDNWEINTPSWAPIKPDVQKIYTPGSYYVRNNYVTEAGIAIRYLDGSGWDTNNRSLNSNDNKFFTLNKDAYIYGANPTQWNYNSLNLQLSSKMGHGMFANGYFMIPALNWQSGAYVKISTNGTSWTDRVAANSATTAAWVASVAYANGRFVAGQSTGYMSYSTDTINWTTGNALPGTGQPTRMVSNGTNRIIAVSTTGSLFTSTDAINWTTATNNVSGYYPNRLRYINNRWYLLNEGGTNSQSISVSTNGTTFNASAVVGLSSGESLYDIAYANINGTDRYVAVTNFCNVIVSTNGFNWTTASISQITRATTYVNRALYAVWYYKNMFVAGGKSDSVSNYKFIASTDGYSWGDITTTAQTTISTTASTTIYDAFGTPSDSSELLKSFVWVFPYMGTPVGTSTSPRQNESSNTNIIGYIYSRFFRGVNRVYGSVGVQKISDGLDLNYTTTATTV